MLKVSSIVVTSLISLWHNKDMHALNFEKHVTILCHDNVIEWMKEPHSMTILQIENYLKIYAHC